MRGKTGVFAMRSPAKRASRTGSQNLTQQPSSARCRIYKARRSSITSCLSAAVAGNENLDICLAQSYGGRGSLSRACRRWCRGLNSIGSLIGRIVSVGKSIARGRRGRGARQAALTNRAGELEGTALAQGSRSSSFGASAEIFSWPRAWLV